MNYQHWLIACVVFIIIEILPPPTNFFFLCMALGALGAAIAAYFGAPIWLIWTIFAGLTVASIPLLIPLAKFLFSRGTTLPSNTDEILNQEADVVEPVDVRQPGTVKVRGELWRAYSEDGPHGKDEKVKVVRIDGTHVFIRRA